MVVDIESLAMRTMTHADLPSVIQNEKAAYPFPWKEALFVDCLRQAYLNKVIISRDEQLIGHVIVSVAAGEAHILNICVHPDVQRQGVARQVMHDVFQQLLERSVETVFLEVRLSNTPAIALYESLGFREIGRRKDYYPAAPLIEFGDAHMTGKREDAIVMALAL